VPKATPRPCTEVNCGDLFPKCGKYSTYKRLKCRCDPCRIAAVEDNRKHRARNPEYQRGYVRRHYQENRSDYIQRSADWYWANLEQAKESRKQYQQENSAAISEYQSEYRERNKLALREYRRSNRHLSRASNQRRRALLIGAYVEDVDNHILFERDGYICAHCGIKCQSHTYPALNYATHDHIIPLSWGVFRGGFHSYANSQTLCYSCNSRKGNRNDN
jgi:5-methylcytosine-specific restriction endonuclease McrA